MKKYDLKKILKYLLIFTLLCILLYYFGSTFEVKALTTNDGMFTCDNNNLADMNTYYVCDDLDNCFNATFNTTYQGKATLFKFRIFEPIKSGHSYNLTISNNTGDFRNISIATIVEFGGLSTQCSNSSSPYTVNSVVANYYNITINFTANGSYNYSYLWLANSIPYITGDKNWRLTSVSMTDLGNTDTTDIVNNQNKNTQDIIDNQKDNTKEIIDNQNDLLGNCTTNIFNINNYTSSNFNSMSFSQDKIIVSSETSWSTISYDFNVEPNEIYTLYFNSSSKSAVFYQNSSGNYEQVKSGSFTQITSKSSNLNIRLQNTDPGSFTFSNLFLAKGVHNHFSPYGEKKCNSKLDDTNKSLNDLKDDINNSNSSGATSDADNFFKDFSTDTFGLTSIITAPLNLISSLTSKTCSNLVLPLPYVNKNLTLPCLSTIYQQFFGDFLTIYQTITFGIVAYWVCIRIFNLVKDFKNPDHDEIEVMDL